MLMGAISVHIAAEALRTDGPLGEGEHSERETGQGWREKEEAAAQKGTGSAQLVIQEYLTSTTELKDAQWERWQEGALLAACSASEGEE